MTKKKKKNIHDIAIIIIIFTAAVDFKQLCPKENQSVSSGNKDSWNHAVRPLYFSLMQLRREGPVLRES